jgi:hypothetical protein
MRTAFVVAIAGVLVGCATTPTYTNPGKSNDPQAMKAALDKCESASKTACSPPGDGYRMCFQRKVQECMQADGWTEK